MKRRILVFLFFILTPVLLFPGGREEKNQPDVSKTSREERLKMVEDQIAEREITDPEVLNAMKTVPRHLFVEPNLRSRAYDDTPLPIKQGQTISQPYIVAYMTEKLRLEDNHSVLEVGTGSGYQAAVLAEITDAVYTIEIIEPLAETARGRLEDLGYSEVKVKNADGYFGWTEYAPFDRIIVTAAAGHIPPPLVEQLKPGGRMIIPVGGVYELQTLILLKKLADGTIETEQTIAVRFVPMTGEAQE